MSRRTERPPAKAVAGETAAPVGVEEVVAAVAVAGPAPPAPFVHRIRIRWSHTDAARIVYTARFADYAIEAIDAWMEDRVGFDWFRMNEEWGIGTPFVHLDCDFRSAVTPRDTLFIAVRVEKIGRTSLAFRVEGRAEADGRLCFEGRLVCVCARIASGYDGALETIPLDPRIRAAAERDVSAAGEGVWA